MSSPVESTAEQPTKSLTKRGWRRFFRFRIVTLLILIAVIAVAFGWWSHGARKQREAVAAFEKVGGTVFYDYYAEGLDNPKYWPQWLVEWLGKDYFSNVVVLSLYKTQISDEWLKHLEGLTALEWIDFTDSQITDEALKHLEGRPALVELGLSGTPVTDEGLKHIEGLTAMGGLSLSNTQVTDKGLEYLEGLTALEQLSLTDTQVTDEGVARLQKKLPNCEITH